jgi:hypothetical protein
MTIHQPRTDILDLLDKIFLLSMGKCVWFGTNNGVGYLTVDALAHFKSLNYPIPENTNPSDFYLDLTTYDQRSEELRKTTKDRIDMFVREFEKKAIEMDGMNEVKTNFDVEKQYATQYPSNILNEFIVLWDRNFKDTVRDVAVLGATFGQSIFLLVFICFI